MAAAFLFLDPAIVVGINVAKIAGDCYSRIGDSQQAIDTFSIDESFVDCDDCLASPSPSPSPSPQASPSPSPIPSPSPSPSPSPEQFCLLEPDCTGHAGDAGVAPGIALSVSNLGATETIIWCGKTWNLPGDNGLRQCVCPTFYEKNTGSSRSSNYERWRYGASLRLEQSINPGAAGINRAQVFVAGGLVNSYYGHYFNLGNTSSTFTGGAGGGFPPQMVQSLVPNVTFTDGGAFIRDGHFDITYTTAGVTYKWDKGKGW